MLAARVSAGKVSVRRDRRFGRCLHGDDPPCPLSERRGSREQRGRMSLFSEPEKDQIEMRPIVAKITPAAFFHSLGRQRPVTGSASASGGCSPAGHGT